MATPTLNPLSWLQLPFSNFFPNFLRTWNYMPRTQWLDHFITINNNGNDGPVEQHVLEEVGSYGLQLSVILDALDCLIAHVDPSTPLTTAETAQLDRLRELQASTKRSVERYRANPAAYRDAPPASLFGL
jgi:hypothetical protein